MYSLKLTNDARSDLSHIRRYTIKQFGESQYQTYRSRLEIGLQHLIEHPEIGFEVDEPEAGYRCLAVQHHRKKAPVVTGAWVVLLNPRNSSPGCSAFYLSRET